MLNDTQSHSIAFDEDDLSIQAIAGQARKISGAVYILETLLDELRREFDARCANLPLGSLRIGLAIEHNMNDLRYHSGMLELNTAEMVRRHEKATDG